MCTIFLLYDIIKINLLGGYMEEEYDFQLLEDNVKLYKVYKMFAYDWVFFYAISVLFFSITKGFSTSQIVYLSGFYTLAYCIFQIRANFLVKKIGLRKSMILGNILSAVTILVYIIAKDYTTFVIIQFVNGLSFALKGLSEGDLLCTTMKRLGKFEKFTKVEGSANSKYYFFDALASVIAGFSFIFHQYLPVILCLIVTIIALIQSFKFNDVELDIDKEKHSLFTSIRHFFDTLSSDRLKSIYMIAFVFTGIIQVNITLYKSILMDIGMQPHIIAILVGFYMLFAGFGSKYEFYFERITKNKTLTVITLTYVICIGIIGIVGLINVVNLFMLSVTMICLCIMGFVHGVYKVALKKYTVSFTTSKIRTRISSIGLMFEYAGTTIISFMVAYLLENIGNSLGSIIIGIVAFLIIFLILKYMDGRLGLKPEEYSSKERNNVDL